MKLKQKIISLFFLLPIACFGAATSHDQEAFLEQFLASYNAVYAEPLGRAEIIRVEEIVDKGVCAQGVFKIILHDRPAIVCKGAFGAIESGNCAYIEEKFIAHYLGNADETYPQFARYLGSFTFKGWVTELEASNPGTALYERMNRTILMFECAQGVPLADIFCMRPLPLTSLRKAASAIAKFHAYSLEDQGGILNAFIHGDLHVDNIFVLPEPFVLTFIDYDELANPLRLGKTALVGEIDYFCAKSTKILKRRIENEKDIEYSMQLFLRYYQKALKALGYEIDIADSTQDDEDESGDDGFTPSPRKKAAKGVHCCTLQ